ncbi:hypothetical protein [Actinophytocola sp.]|uniref:VMAP-C domain-containing protein n=1 Tax=Actinophytocola sp. TaxID=1872138 RepID=UPI003D6A8722
MTLGAPTLHWSIVLVDVADFTNPGRTAVHRQEIQHGMYTVLREAFDESGVGWASCEHEDRGDGAMVLVPANVSKKVLADLFVTRLLAALRRYNATRVAEASIAMRVVLHFGEITRNSPKADGEALNNAFRMLETKDAKTELKDSGEMLAVIASTEFYRDVIKHEPAAEPDSYQVISAQVKGFSSEVWLRIPGIGATPAAPPGPVRTGEKPVETDEFVHDVLPEQEWKRVRDWLTDIEVPNLAELARRAAGPAIPLPRLRDPWHAFTHLADFNAGPDAVPPSLLFLDVLARQIGGEMGRTVIDWIEARARHLTIGPALRARRAAMARTVAEPRLHLVIMVDRDAVDRDRYVVSFWRQDIVDEWPPARGAVGEVRSAELERVVDAVVVEAERAWADQRAAVVLEFLLPRGLLGLPVHRWRKEHDTGDPRPLCLDYQIRVRSLERMRAAHWHRVWRDRWHSMLEDPSPTRIHFASGEDGRRVDAVLSEPHWVSMVLEAPGDRPASAGTDELTAALRSGLPVLIWHPDLPPEELREIVDWLAESGGLIEVPQRAQVSRRAALGATELPIDLGVAKDVVILWDDPTRLVELDARPM